MEQQRAADVMMVEVSLSRAAAGSDGFRELHCGGESVVWGMSAFCVYCFSAYACATLVNCGCGLSSTCFRFVCLSLNLSLDAVSWCCLDALCGDVAAALCRWGTFRQRAATVARMSPTRVRVLSSSTSVLCLCVYVSMCGDRINVISKESSASNCHSAFCNTILRFAHARRSKSERKCAQINASLRGV